ncbi:MAG: hypothetical protein ACJ78Q_11990 [Chloroflexia bacterium]
MALFGEKQLEEITALVRGRYDELGATLGEAPSQDKTGMVDDKSPLRRDLKLLAGVANGEFGRSDAMVRRVELALGRLMELLVGNALHGRATLPGDFWRTTAGVLVSRARWWISIDDLITISNAAALAFGENTQANRMRISRAMDNGLLEWIPDPSVANPQQNRRVLRPQVERLRDLSRLPE